MIKKDPNPLPATQMDDINHITYYAALKGTMFKQDSKKVLRVLKKLTI